MKKFSELTKSISLGLDLKEEDGRYLFLKNIDLKKFPWVPDAIGQLLNSRVSFLTFSNIKHFAEWIAEGGDQELEVEKTLKKGDRFDENILINAGYTRTKKVWEPGEFSLLGDSVTFWENGSEYVVKISLWGDKIEQLYFADARTRRKIQEIDMLTFAYDMRENVVSPVSIRIGNELAKTIFDKTFVYIPSFSIKDVDRLSMVFDDFSTVDLGVRPIPGGEYLMGDSDALKSILSVYENKGYQISVISTDAESIQLPEEIDLEQNLYLIGDSLAAEQYPRGFLLLQNKKIYLSDYELLGLVNLTFWEDERSADSVESAFAEQKNRRGSSFENKEDVKETDEKKDSSALFSSSVGSTNFIKRIRRGDYVVHEDHGIGLFRGIVRRDSGEYFDIKYAGKDRLLVPLSQSIKLMRYVGAGYKSPKLSGLSRSSWKRTKNSARKDTERMAKELLQLYSMRELVDIKKLLTDSQDLDYLRQFVDEFEYEDTEDQVIATDKLVELMQDSKPMDLLLVGDVGFGKTEIAMRAAFIAANSGKQVALLSPTTVLVEQHTAVFKERFKKFPLEVASLSRFLTKKEKEESIEKLEKGKIDIVIGTHGLLADRVKFKDLGLLIIDEEQKFGVRHKEKMKTERLNTHVLSMTATPIPRSLHLALSGAKDIVMLATPPVGRKSINNIVKRFDWDIVIEAVNKEIERGGQIYYLHNRVRELLSLAKKISRLIPDLKITLAHGQMSPRELSQNMSDFSSGKIDLLLCTTIVENGLDLPNVNTMIIDDVERLGLAQMYQLRGRIGRADRQAFCYFLYKSLAGKTALRLEALEEFSDLASGFLLASRDLEIRGAGSILGDEQSGVVSKIGYGMFVNMLSKEVSRLKKETKVLDTKSVKPMIDDVKLVWLK